MRITKFLSIGVCQFVLDFLVFVLLQKLGVVATIANTASRFLAGTLGYYLNKKYTFAIGPVLGYSMMARYWMFWGFMTLLSSTLISVWDTVLNNVFSNATGKILIELGLFLLSFVISKLWVYKHARR